MSLNMQFIELTAKSVEEAKALASKKLNVAEENIVVTVLEQNKGLFGRTQMRVRAEIANQDIASDSQLISSVVAEDAVPPVAEDASKSSVKEKTMIKKRSPRSNRSTKTNATENASENNADLSIAAGTAIVETVESVTEHTPITQAPVVANEADVDRVVSIVAELLRLAEIEADINVKGTSGRYVNLELDGKDLGHLIGKTGEVLNSFQYIANLIIIKELNNGVRMTVDGNNYRSRREVALKQLAEDIAQQVTSRQEEAVLDALPAFERRVVHKALESHPEVMTYSEGEEPSRRVVIAPK